MNNYEHVVFSFQETKYCNLSLDAIQGIHKRRINIIIKAALQLNTFIVVLPTRYFFSLLFLHLLLHLRSKRVVKRREK